MRHLIAIFFMSASPAFAACPDPNLEAPSYTATGAELITPQNWEVAAQGDQPIPCEDWITQGVRIGENVGFLSTAPTAVFELTGLGPHILMVMAQADCGPVLAARTGDGLWYLGESANGRQEIVLWGAGDGPMQVWVGSNEEAGCDATLTLETFDR